MARYSRLVKPLQQELLHLQVLRTERLSPHWMRVTVGGGDIDQFTPMGYDQWFRLFLPVGGDEGLERIPAKANRMLGYLRYLRIPEGMRPVMRNYTVRSHRPATQSGGAELDIDFVLHGDSVAGTAGPASSWAETCTAGESIIVIDEGLTFNPARGVDSVLLVGDATALPAIAGIAAALPATARGRAIIEVPGIEDALEFDHPDGLAVEWVVQAAGSRPGEAALDLLSDIDIEPVGLHAFVAGEQGLATGGRRHLVGRRGLSKDAVSFCGYWRSTGDPTATHSSSATR